MERTFLSQSSVRSGIALMLLALRCGCTSAEPDHGDGCRSRHLWRRRGRCHGRSAGRRSRDCEGENDRRRRHATRSRSRHARRSRSARSASDLPMTSPTFDGASSDLSRDVALSIGTVSDTPGGDRLARSGESNIGHAVAVGRGPSRDPGAWLDRALRRSTLRSGYERRGHRPGRRRSHVSVRQRRRLRLQRRPDRWRARQSRRRPLRLQPGRRRRDRAGGSPAGRPVVAVGRRRDDLGRADHHEAGESDRARPKCPARSKAARSTRFAATRVCTAGPAPRSTIAQRSRVAEPMARSPISCRRTIGTRRRHLMVASASRSARRHRREADCATATATARLSARSTYGARDTGTAYQTRDLTVVRHRLAHARLAVHWKRECQLLPLSRAIRGHDRRPVLHVCDPDRHTQRALPERHTTRPPHRCRGVRYARSGRCAARAWTVPGLVAEL